MNLTALLALIFALGTVLALKSLVSRLILRQAARKVLSDVGKRALNRVPEQITLTRTDSPQWKHPAEVDRQSAPLLRAGFTDLGSYAVDSMPDVLIRMLFHPETYVASHIYDHPRVGSWIDFATRYTDDSSHTLTTLPPAGLDHPAWVRTICADKNIPTDRLYRQFLTQRQGHNIKPVPAEEMIHEFERGYLRLMIWRQNAGITPEEVAHVAMKWTRKQPARVVGAIG